MLVMGQQVITKHFTGLLAMGMLTLLSFYVVKIKSFNFFSVKNVNSLIPQSVVVVKVIQSYSVL